MEEQFISRRKRRWVGRGLRGVEQVETGQGLQHEVLTRPEKNKREGGRGD